MHISISATRLKHAQPLHSLCRPCRFIVSREGQVNVTNEATKLSFCNLARANITKLPCHSESLSEYRSAALRARSMLTSLSIPFAVAKTNDRSACCSRWYRCSTCVCVRVCLLTCVGALVYTWQSFSLFTDWRPLAACIHRLCQAYCTVPGQASRGAAVGDGGARILASIPALTSACSCQILRTW